MLKPSIGRTNTCNYINAALMAVMTILQFTPFWHADGKGYSISQYIWMTYEYTDFEKYLKNAVGASYDLTSYVFLPILILLCCVVGIVCCLRYRDNDAPGLLGLVAGVSGIICFLTKPVYQLGSLWILYLVLSIAMVLVSVVSLISLIGWLIEKTK